MSTSTNDKKPDRKNVYETPKLETLGHMARVTQKSGTPPDQNQVAKPGGGGG